MPRSRAKNIARAGFGDDRRHPRRAGARHACRRSQAEARGPFDLVFLDADKPNNPAYFEWALKLTRKGSLIVADNVVRYGALIDSGEQAIRT